jgi:hypothetical protein
MTRECHVRFCERLGVKLSGATLPTGTPGRRVSELFGFWLTFGEARRFDCYRVERTSSRWVYPPLKSTGLSRRTGRTYLTAVRHVRSGTSGMLAGGIRRPGSGDSGSLWQNLQ